MKNTQKFTVTTLSATMMLGLTGCAATRNAEKDVKQTWSNSQDVFTGAQPRSTASVLDNTREKNANFAKVQKNWVNPTPIPKDFINKKAETLPSFFQKKVSYTMPGSVSLVEVVSEIKRTQKINVFMAQDIYYSTVSLGQIITGTEDNNTEVKESAPIRISDFVVSNLTLQEALDFLASKANISWKWTGEEIEFFRYETKTYTINLLPGVTNMNSSVNLSSETESKSGSSSSSSSNTTGARATNNSGAEQAGSASSSASQGVTRTSKMDSWADITKYLRPLMSSRGKLAVMETTGVITITDTPDVHRKVGQAVKSLNNVLSKQIMLKVDIYSVTLSDSDDYGLDLNLAFTGSDRWGFSFNSLSGSSGTSTGTLNFTGSNRWQAGAVLKALSTVGQASIVNQFNVATLNGQPTPIGNNRKIPYISGIEVAMDANGNPMQSIETAAVYQGISMNITPKLLPNGKILIEYAMNMSDLLGFETLSTGGDPATSQSLSLPNTTLNNILQRAAVKSGQAMVLSGFKQRVNSSSRRGSPTPNTPLLGGGVNAETKEQYLVVVVTPTVSQDNEE